MMRSHDSRRRATTTAAHIRSDFNASVLRSLDIAEERGRKITGIGLLLLITLGMPLFIVGAKPAWSQGVQLVNVNVDVVAKGYRLSKLLGATVKNDKDENIGKIDEVIIDNNKNMFTVLQVGGFLGLGSHYIAIPYDHLTISEDGKQIVLPNASKEELKKLAEFKYLG